MKSNIKYYITNQANQSLYNNYNNTKNMLFIVYKYKTKLSLNKCAMIKLTTTTTTKYNQIVKQRNKEIAGRYYDI